MIIVVELQPGFEKVTIQRMCAQMGIKSLSDHTQMPVGTVRKQIKTLRLHDFSTYLCKYLWASFFLGTYIFS